MSQELFTVNVSLPISGGGTVAAGTFTVPILPIPGTADGGGIYLVRAAYSSNVAIAAGSAPDVKIVSLTSASLGMGPLSMPQPDGSHKRRGG